MKDTAQMIEAGKQFNKSVQELYDAWINPKKLKQWWQPAGNKLVYVENTVKEGGQITYDLKLKKVKSLLRSVVNMKKWNRK